MKEAQVILNRLLDKFENSKHLSEPNTSRRRVMLRIDKRELPEYQYEDAVVRDAYNIAARELEQQALVRLEWARKQSWIWNGSHSAMNAPTECIREKRQKRLQASSCRSWQTIPFHGSLHGGMLYVFRRGTA